MNPEIFSSVFVFALKVILLFMFQYFAGYFCMDFPLLTKMNF